MAGWIAIAATVNNEVIIAHDEIAVLQAISEKDFDVIPNVYAVKPKEYEDLKTGNYDFKIKFNSLRSTELVATTKTDHARELTDIYRQRLSALTALRGRLEHALHKHRSLLSLQQQIIYNEKVDEAIRIINGEEINGFVLDYAIETNMPVTTAANLIIQKYNGQKEYLRKIELLRLRHMNAIKVARTAKDFELAQAAVDKDLFINMLL